MATNPTTVWTTLALPYYPTGAVPFVNSDAATINIDVLNFWWNQTAAQLSIKTNGDQTGSDSINTYYNVDTYWPWLSTTVAAGVMNNSNTAGFTVSSSRGTGSAPSYSLTGDFIGKFSAWSWVGATPAWTEVSGINNYVTGVNTSNLGGELRLFTKGDNGVQVEWAKLTNAGQFAPVVAGATSLGYAAFGWKQLNLAYNISAVVGSQTLNVPTGSFKIAAGNSSAIITNSLVTANSIVLAVLQTNDTTALYVRSVIPAAGNFTVNLSANATAQVTVAFLVVNTDS